MVQSLCERAWEFVCATFPERQIYIRSDGRVQFFTFNSLMQSVLAGVTVLVLGWVAFTSVNTIFKDRIIAAKEQNYRQMQGDYEARISNLQLSYDELNAAVIATEDHFRTIADDLEARHRTLAGLIRGKEKLREELGLEAAPSDIELGAPPDSSAASPLSGVEPEPTVRGSVSAPAPATVKAGLTTPTLPATGNSTRPVQLGIGIPAPSFLEGTVRRLGRFFRGQQTEGRNNHPSLRQMEELESRLDRLLPVQLALITEVRNEINRDVGRFDETIKLAGLKTKTLLDQADNYAGGVGGPELAIPHSSFSGNDPTFHEIALEATASFVEFTQLATALRAMPMVAPVPGENYGQSSGFGARHDPFTKQLAFHSGIDFSGPSGTNVLVTAPGKVVFAGPNGAYGNSVEVDHGYGLRTRYGHLSKILVTVGSELNEGAVVGKLGSTGRTTGPHLHYEVWFNDTVRNPSKFLRAGRYVHEEQGS